MSYRNLFTRAVRKFEPLYNIYVPSNDITEKIEWDKPDVRNLLKIEYTDILPSFDSPSYIPYDYVTKTAKVSEPFLGRIPILAMHHLDLREGSNVSISSQQFRNTLANLYNEGYVLVSLSDIVTNNLNSIPKGRKPLCLTMDDAADSQFNLVKEVDGNIYVNPTCAIGILQEFSRKHQDFGFTGAFFIDFYKAPFGNWDNFPAVLSYLYSSGFDIGAHTITGQSLEDLPKAEVYDEIAQSKILLESVVGEGNVDFFAFPMGYFPKNVALKDILSFEYGEREIEFDAFVKIKDRFNPAVTDPEYMKDKVLFRWEINEHFFDNFFKHNDAYVSDGSTHKKQLPKNGYAPQVDKYIEFADVTSSMTFEDSGVEFDLIIFTDRFTPISADIIGFYPVSINWLQRFLPVKSMIELASARYSLDPLWLAQLLYLESTLDPTAINTTTDDYGIAQVKLSNFDIGFSLVTTEDSPYFTSLFDPNWEKNVFNPEQTILIAAALNRYNIERSKEFDQFKHPILNSDQLAAAYHGGPKAVLADGTYSSKEEKYVSALNGAFVNLRPLVRTLLINPEELGNIKNKELSDTLNIYYSNSDAGSMYYEYMATNLNALKNTSEVSSMQVARRYENAVIFSLVLDNAYFIDTNKERQELLDIGYRLSGSINVNSTLPSGMGIVGSVIDENSNNIALLKIMEESIAKLENYR
ncbi:MAG: polysaccharide deacetylase family protein [Candidatus Woesearchaeota archaeon]|nr:polysaccharide deacetylase family protein [Candidatus Woesearchaeota archaeon]